MFKTSPEPGREELRFTEEVLAAFSFLTTEYDFRCLGAEVTFVRYESPRVFVNIYHGRASYELGVEIGQLAESGQVERPFSIGEIIELMDARADTGYTFLQAGTPERVGRFIPQLAGYVRKYAGSALRGDQLTYRQLGELRARGAEREAREMKLREVRPEADKAWRNKDYARLVELYESLRNDLTPGEAKKLEYARKHLS